MQRPECFSKAHPRASRLAIPISGSPPAVRGDAAFCPGVQLAGSLVSILPHWVLFPREHTGCFDKRREVEPDVPFGGESEGVKYRRPS